MNNLLCIGNGTQEADSASKILSILYNIDYNGLLNTEKNAYDGCYHTSLYDLTFNNLVEIGKKFKKVVLLDQDKNQYKTPHDFYESIRVLYKLKEFTEISFVNESHNTNTLDYLNKNKSFCIMPFIAMKVERGGVTTCCFTTHDITSLEHFNFYSNEQFNKLRSDILADKLPKICKNCHDLENQGILSDRQILTTEWLLKTETNTCEDIKPSLLYYDIRHGNNCNLMCRMCEPELSNLIDTEFNRIGLSKKKFNLLQADNFHLIDINTVKNLYVAGGEPTIDKSFSNFLVKCIEQKKTDFEININTNCAAISEKFLNLCSNFSNLKFEISLDGYDKTNEYIRWPLKWEKFVENVEKVSYISKQKISFAAVISIYNIPKIYELLKFANDFFPTTPFHITYVGGNRVLPSWKFPNKNKVLEEIAKVKTLEIYRNQESVKSKIDGIEQKIINENLDLQKLQDFFNFNDLLDKSRNINLKDYIPELEECRKLIMKQI